MTKGLKINFSLIILLSGILVASFGLVAIYDASAVDAFKTFGDKYHYIKQQASWLVLGSIAAIITSKIPLGLIKKIAPQILTFSLFLMVLVLIPGIGSKFLGARRWLSVGPITIQPSEILKISLVLYLSGWLEKPRELSKFLTIIGICLSLIMLQPDLGTAIITLGTSFMVYYLSGAPIKNILMFSGTLLVALVLLIVLSPYRLDRVKTFLDPTSDPLGRSYHINQVLYGIGSGGLGGVGLGRSRQKYAFLPEATTDSIFVIIAEEFGFIGSSLIVGFLVYLIYLSFKISVLSKEKFNKLLGSGVSLLFLVQVFVNLGSMVAIIPLTGVPLPFISYGGSSLVSNFIALGLLINVSQKI